MSPPKSGAIFTALAVTALTAGIAPAALVLSTDTVSRPGYTVVMFTAGSGEWTVPIGVTTIEVLVVGGGGGGGNTAGNGGGGGAGGLIYYGANTINLGSGYSVTPGANISIEVGAGGTANFNGSDSLFDTLTAIGGGRGGGGAQEYGFDGGSGGGAATQNPAGAALQPGSASGGFGNAGGGASFAGGGGAGGAGLPYPGNSGTVTGGIGLAYDITGSLLFYAAGGGGPASYGGSGIGGSSLENGVAGTDGAANTGSGGGGGWTSIGGNGGSGVVIVAYQTIPEPGTWALAGLALVPLVFRRSRTHR